MENPVPTGRYRRGLSKIVRPKLPTCTVTDVEHVDLLRILQDAKYHTVEVRLVPIHQVPQLFLLRRRGASVWMVLQTENGLLETALPFQGCIGLISVDLLVQVGKIALSAK